MKGFFTPAFLGLMISINLYADVEQTRHSGDTGTAQVDEHYLRIFKPGNTPDKEPNLDREKSGYEHMSKQLDKQKMEESLQKPGSEAETHPGPHMK